MTEITENIGSQSVQIDKVNDRIDSKNYEEMLYGTELYNSNDKNNIETVVWERDDSGNEI